MLPRSRTQRAKSWPSSAEARNKFAAGVTRVVMIPIDAMTNLGFEDIVKGVEQVKPPIVIPMHYDVAFASRCSLDLRSLSCYKFFDSS